MKKYIKPEIEIVEFDVIENVTEDTTSLVVPPYEEGEGGMDWESDAAFYGIEVGEEGYLVN